MKTEIVCSGTSSPHRPRAITGVSPSADSGAAVKHCMAHCSISLPGHCELLRAFAESRAMLCVCGGGGLFCMFCFSLSHLDLIKFDFTFENI